MSAKQEKLAAVLTAAPVVPVLTIEDVATAVPLAKALVAGGLTALEVTLRTAAGLDCIRAIKAEVEGCNVGAGTVLDAKQLEDAVAAGATFMVSPGGSPKLLAAAKDSPVPFLPGAATAGEAMTLYEEGFTILKFFPAEAAGGIPMLKSFAGPFADVRFCPTGGITPANAPAYLALPNVITVGGSWMVPGDAIRAKNWSRIEALARESAALRQPSAR